MTLSVIVLAIYLVSAFILVVEAHNIPNHIIEKIPADKGIIKIAMFCSIFIPVINTLISIQTIHAIIKRNKWLL